MTSKTKQKDYVTEISNLADYLRRVSAVHDVKIDKILFDVEMVLVEEKNFTRERYIGVYKVMHALEQRRINIPAAAPVSDAYHIYITEWKDLILRPVSVPGRSKIPPIIEA
jgi:hypothetical protein